MDIIYHKNIDARRLKSNLLKNYNEQVAFWRNLAEKYRQRATIEVTACPICDSDRSEEAARVYGWIYVGCLNCTHVYKRFRLPDQLLLDFYRETGDVINYSDT